MRLAKRFFPTGLCLLGAAALYAGVAAADPIEAVTFSTSAVASFSGPTSAGFAFSVNTPIQVTDLGAFDAGGDGFLNSHDVGIFDGSSFTLLASTTVSSSDPLVDGFRYHPITPLTLDSSTFYVVAAGDFSGAGEDPLSFVLPANLTVAPDITYSAGEASTVHAGLVQPNLVFNPDVVPFGGSFRYTVTPEPEDLDLFLAGFLGLAVLRPRRRS